MDWNDHSVLTGKHAFLSASRYHWVNYDHERLEAVYNNYRAVRKGTELHAFAALAISLKQKLPRTKQTLNMFVNDAIGFKMSPEITLYYSENSYGTADAISFRSNKLRIHDLKTGYTRASLKQLEIYAALFCLEYGFSPKDIEIELRLYQSREVLIDSPDFRGISFIMDKIKTFDSVIRKLEEGDL